MPSSAESSDRNGKEIKKEVDVEIISREDIKPASPTPHHLRTFNLSIIDQIMYDVYTPWILFLPMNDADHIVTKNLKEALSKILTTFYPLAGKLMDNLHIDCNDEGVCYVEARVNQTLEEFLDHPDDARVRMLLPETPSTSQSSAGNYVLGIQVNIFKCGGIGLSTSMSHKIFDGQTIYLFMQAWASAAKGSPQTLPPSFVASQIFPNNPNLQYSVPSKLLATKPLTTKRFVFDTTALASLKIQLAGTAGSTRPPTRMEAATTVVWKTAVNAASKVRPFGPQSPYALLSMVNLRKRASPSLPEEAIGNLIDSAGAICVPASNPDLATLNGELRESIAKINAEKIESLKGEKGHETYFEILKNLNYLVDIISEGDCLVVSSLLNLGMYELDFGWGKPIWFYPMNAGIVRFLALNDMPKGGGVEAILTLSPEEMEIFECDFEVLAYANVNPSPLRFGR